MFSGLCSCLVLVLCELFSVFFVVVMVVCMLVCSFCVLVVC